MKFPKLKHPWLCQHLLYAPAYLAFAALFLPLILKLVGRSVPDWIWGLGVLLLMLLAIWYLFRFIFLLLMSDAVFSEIHTWQRDRLEFSSRINGSSRETAERRILRRCRLWGRRWKDGSDGRFTVWYRHAYSWTRFRSMIEERVVLCRTEHLSPEQYSLLLGQARSLLRRLPDGKVRFRTKQEKRAPRAYVSLIVILADSVDETVKAKARELPLNSEDACILPCVAECPTGHYYMNGGKDPFLTGWMGRPPRNYARGLARRLVFAVGLPKKNPDKRPPYPGKVDLESSLWDYLREYRKEEKQSRTGEDKERVKMLRRLGEGEVRVGEYAVYCKHQGRLAEWAFLPDEEREKTLSLLPGDTWYYQKESLKGFPGFRNEYNRRKMKPDQIKEIDRRIRSALTAEGWTVLSSEAPPVQKPEAGPSRQKKRRKTTNSENNT